MKNADDFHAHLDKCMQCRENPFDLCPKGHELLTGEKPKERPSMGMEMRSNCLKCGAFFSFEAKSFIDFFSVNALMCKGCEQITKL